MIIVVINYYYYSNTYYTVAIYQFKKSQKTLITYFSQYIFFTNF